MRVVFLICGSLYLCFSMVGCNSNQDAAPSSAGATPIVVPPSNAGCGTPTGTVTSKNVNTADGARAYFYHVSSAAAPAAGRPILIFLHGDGGSGGAAQGASQYWGCTDPDASIVIAVQGLEQGGWSWNQRVDQSGRKDAEYISKVAADAVASLGGNANKIYLTGESAGGTMIYSYLAAYGDGIANVASKPVAVAPNAGSFYCNADDVPCNAGLSGGTGADFAWNGAFFHVHGTADGVVPPPDTAWSGYAVNWAWKNGSYSAGQNFPVVSTFTAPDGHLATVYEIRDDAVASTGKYLQVLVAGSGHVISGMEPRIWAELKKH